MKKKQARWLRLFFLGMVTALGVFIAFYFFPIGLSLFASSLIVLTSSLLAPFVNKPNFLKVIKERLTTKKTEIANPKQIVTHEPIPSPDENGHTEIEVITPFKLSVSGSTEEGEKKRKTIVSQSNTAFDPNKCSTLAEGGFGKVFMVRTQETESKVYFFAIKAAKRDFFSWLLPTEEEDALKSETDILISLKHSNILPVYGRFTTKNYDCMVMPLMDVSLSQHVENQTETIDDNWIATVTRCILSGLAYLHENGWVHRDIKLDNILIKKNDKKDSKLKVCLADFGLAERENSQTTFAGTLPWVSPELYTHFFDEKKTSWKLTSADDIYPIALIIYCLCDQLTQPCPDTAEWCRKQIKVNAPYSRFKTIIFRAQQKMSERPSAKALLDIIPNSQETSLSAAH